MEVLDEIEKLRVAHLKELTDLSKMLIAIASGALSLLLSPSGIAISVKAGASGTIAVWIFLIGAAVLGLSEVFVFSDRFRSRAEYLWSSVVVDTSIGLDHMVGRLATDEKLNGFLNKSDYHRKRYDQRYKLCMALALAQAVFLLAGFCILAYPVFRIVRASK